MKKPPRCDARKVVDGVTLVCRRADGHGRPGTFGRAAASEHLFRLMPTEEDNVQAVREVRTGLRAALVSMLPTESSREGAPVGDAPILANATLTHIFGRTPSTGTYFVADNRGERLDLSPEEARVVIVGLTDMLEEDGVDV